MATPDNPDTGGTVTVTAYAVNRDGLDAHGRTGVVTAGPAGDRGLYDVQIPGWGTAHLAASELVTRTRVTTA